MRWHVGGSLDGLEEAGCEEEEDEDLEEAQGCHDEGTEKRYEGENAGGVEAVDRGDVARAEEREEDEEEVKARPSGVLKLQTPVPLLPNRLSSSHPSSFSPIHPSFQPIYPLSKVLLQQALPSLSRLHQQPGREEATQDHVEEALVGNAEEQVRSAQGHAKRKHAHWKPAGREERQHEGGSCGRSGGEGGGGGGSGGGGSGGGGGGGGGGGRSGGGGGGGGWNHELIKVQLIRSYPSKVNLVLLLV